MTNMSAFGLHIFRNGEIQIIVAKETYIGNGHTFRTIAKKNKQWCLETYDGQCMYPNKPSFFLASLISHAIIYLTVGFFTAIVDVSLVSVCTSEIIITLNFIWWSKKRKLIFKSIHRYIKFTLYNLDFAFSLQFRAMMMFAVLCSLWIERSWNFVDFDVNMWMLEVFKSPLQFRIVESQSQKSNLYGYGVIMWFLKENLLHILIGTFKTKMNICLQKILKIPNIMVTW
jgi:hypothetical protein